MRKLRAFKTWMAAVLPVSLLVTLAPAVAAATFSITTTSLPNGVDGVAYTAQLASANGTGTVTWKLASGSSLVAPLKLSAAGVVSGTPTGSTDGPGSFKVVATDSASPAHTATATIAYIINPQNGSFRITTTQFPNGTVGNPYSSSIKTSAGSGAATFMLIDSTKLPPGLKLSSAGAITGTPTAASTGTNFWVQASYTPSPSRSTETVNAYLSIVVSPSAISVSPLTLTGATVGKSFSAALKATGGKSPYSWSIVGDSTFDGLSLGASTGDLTGTPTTPTVGKLNSSFQVEVSDSASPKNTDFATIAITIAPAPVKIQTTSLPGGVVGSSYKTTLTATGGIAPFTWLIESPGGAPGGLTLSLAGVLSGKPTTASGGTPTTFVVTVLDSEKTPLIAIATMSIVITDPLTVDQTLSPAYVGSQYSGLLEAGGGTPPYKWSLPSGSKLPDGLTLNSDGAITGKATTAAPSFSFKVKVSDSSIPGQSVTTSITLPVYAALTQCTPTDPSATTNARLKGAYSFQLEQILLAYGGDADWVLGAFTADGSGNITGGLYDLNGPDDPDGDDTGTFTGTYSIGTDDRGLLTVNTVPSTGKGKTYSYCIALDSISNGVAGAGQMVEDDATDVVSHGRFFAQGSSDFTESSVKGSWAFGVQGGKIDSNGLEARQEGAGYMTLDGAGNVTVGEMDGSADAYTGNGSSVDNHYTAQASIKGTYTLASSGRGTLTLTQTPSGGSPQTSHFVFYAAGSSQILMLTTDRGLVSPGTNENNVVLVGQGLMRTTSTFNNATLNGNSVSVSEGLALNGDSESYGRKIQVGVIDWDGKGNLTGSADVNSAGFVTLAADNPIAGTYSVDADGRVTVTATKGYFAPKIYLVGPNQGFAVEASAAVPFYQFENQIVPAGGFTADSFNGDYSFGSLWYSFVQETALSGEIAVDDGAESANGTLDQNTAGQIAVNQATSYSYTPSPTGRFVKWVGSTAENAIYMVSPSNAYSIDISGKPWSTLFEYNIQQAPVTP